MSLINVHYLSIISNFHVLFVGCLRVVGVRGVSICATKASTRPEMFYFNLDWKKIERGQMGQKDRSLNGPLWYCKTKKIYYDGDHNDTFAVAVVTFKSYICLFVSFYIVSYISVSFSPSLQPKGINSNAISHYDHPV
jgi:hypothetical protein